MTETTLFQLLLEYIHFGNAQIHKGYHLNYSRKFTGTFLLLNRYFVNRVVKSHFSSVLTLGEKVTSCYSQ